MTCTAGIRRRRLVTVLTAGFGVLFVGMRELGDGVMFGTGSILVAGVKIGAWSVVGAGAVVLRAVPDRCVVFGNPARVLSKI